MEDILKKANDNGDSKLSAIIICDPPDPVSGNKALKYSHVDCSNKGLDKFLIFAAKFPTAHHVNFYGKKSRAYLGQIYLQ